MEKVYILQTRWIGGDEWTNDVYAAPTKEQAEAKALEVEQENENELAKDDGREPVQFETFEDLIRHGDGEFLAYGWEVPV